MDVIPMQLNAAYRQSNQIYYHKEPQSKLEDDLNAKDTFKAESR